MAQFKRLFQVKFVNEMMLCLSIVNLTDSSLHVATLFVKSRGEKVKILFFISIAHKKQDKKQM